MLFIVLCSTVLRLSTYGQTCYQLLQGSNSGAANQGEDGLFLDVIVPDTVPEGPKARLYPSYSTSTAEAGTPARSMLAHLIANGGEGSVPYDQAVVLISLLQSLIKRGSYERLLQP